MLDERNENGEQISGPLIDEDDVTDLVTSEAFDHFCNACYEIRKGSPTISVKTLFAAMVVASRSQPMSFSAFSKRIGSTGNKFKAEVEMLSTGAYFQTGHEFVETSGGRAFKDRLIGRTEKGIALRKTFTSKQRRISVKDSVIPILELIKEVTPTLRIGGLCIFLYAFQNRAKFARNGSPSTIITDDLGIQDLNRTLNALAKGTPIRRRYALEKPKTVEMRPGLELIHIMRDSDDQRRRQPRLTEKGLDLISRIDGLLTGAK